VAWPGADGSQADRLAGPTGGRGSAPRIDGLPREAAITALTEPAKSRGVIFDQDALSYVFEQTDGYPYFLQQHGKYA